MKKKIRDITFKEFVEWANDRCCDGMWNLADAISSTNAIERVYKIKPFFGKKKARENEWKRIKGEYFYLDEEIDI